MKTARIKVENKNNGIITEKSFFVNSEQEAKDAIDSAWTNYEILSLEIIEL